MPTDNKGWYKHTTKNYENMTPDERLQELRDMVDGLRFGVETTEFMNIFTLRFLLQALIDLMENKNDPTV